MDLDIVPSARLGDEARHELVEALALEDAADLAGDVVERHLVGRRAIDDLEEVEAGRSRRERSR